MRIAKCCVSEMYKMGLSLCVTAEKVALPRESIITSV